MRISGSFVGNLRIRTNRCIKAADSTKNALNLSFNMGDKSEDGKKGGKQRRVLRVSLVDNQLTGVSARSKKIKKQNNDEQKKAKEHQCAKADLKKKILRKEWENKNMVKLESGIPIVYVDGACKNNDLFMRKRKSGQIVSEVERLRVKASFGIYWGEKHPLNLSKRLPYKKQTNNRAELAAVVMVMKQAQENGIPELIIFTDSEYVVNMFNDWLQRWKGNNWLRDTGERIVNLDLVKELDKLQQKVDVQIAHVPGHIGVQGNEEAHNLAQKAIRENFVHEYPDVWPKDA